MVATQIPAVEQLEQKVCDSDVCRRQTRAIFAVAGVGVDSMRRSHGGLMVPF